MNNQKVQEDEEQLIKQTWESLHNIISNRDENKSWKDSKQREKNVKLYYELDRYIYGPYSRYWKTKY